MDLWQQALAADGTPDGLPQAVTTGIGIRSAMLTADGAKLAYSRGNRVANVWRVPILPDREATWNEAEQLTFDQAYIESVDLAPDGERLFVSSDRMGNQDLWELPLGGGAMRQLTAEPTPDWHPFVSPNGEEIVFYSYRSGNRDLWVVPITGGPAQQLTRHEGVDQMPQWSPDGKEIAFHSDRSGNRDVWVISRAGGEPRQLTTHPAPDWAPRWSPDGQWIVFASLRSGSRGAWRIRSAGGTAEPIAQLGNNPFFVWSPDGESMYLIRDGGLWEVSVDATSERRLVDLQRTRVYLHDSDGHYVYFTVPDNQGDIWVMDVVTDESE